MEPIYLEHLPERLSDEEAVRQTCRSRVIELAESLACRQRVLVEIDKELVPLLLPGAPDATVPQSR